MQVLTPSGYIDINDLNIGDEVIAYDINDGHVIINILEGKNKWTYDMFPAVPPVYELDAEGNIVYDEDGNPIVLEPGKTSEEVFQETYGDWKFYKINDTWTLFCNQSIWANGNVTHASELQIGDIIYDDQDQDITITYIEEVDAPYWWRLDISGDHSYIADDLTLHNASRYWVGGGSSANWNATANTNWGSTSGGTNNASVPTSADDVTFDGAGTNGNTNSTISATITILSLNITTGYTATMTHNAVLTIAGNWTFRTGYTIAGTSGVTISAASTITSNGRTWPNNLTFSSTNTKTLIGDLTVSGLLTISGTTTLNSTTAEVANLSGGITLNSSLSGTAKINLTGGTWSGNNGFTNDLDLNGNVTISGTVVYSTGVLNYISGTVTTTGSTFNYRFCTLNTNGISWNNVLIGNGDSTLTSNLNVYGTITFTASAFGTTNKTTNETINVYGTLNGGGLSARGTADFYLLSGSTWTGTGIFDANLFIDGNCTVSGTVRYGYTTSCTLTYLSGTVTTTGSTLALNHTTSNITLNTNGIIWNNISFNSAGSITANLTSNLTASGLLTISGSTTINTSVGSTLTTSGGITVNAALSGTAKVILTGGTWSGTNTVGISNNLDIDGNVTISGNVYYNSGTLTYVSGTVTTTGSTFNLLVNNTTATLNTSGILWNNITLSGQNIGVSLTSNLSLSGLLSLNASGNYINSVASQTITAGGGLSVINFANGNTKIILTGGTWTTSSYITNPIDLNGNVTISGTIRTRFANITYVSGTITTTGSTLSLESGNSTLNTNGMTWENLSFSASGSTCTIASNLSINGVFGVYATTTINSSAGITCTSAGGLVVNALLAGNSKLILTGGTWSGSQDFSLDLDINGNVTISGTVRRTGGTLTYLSGKVIQATNTTFSITASTTVLNFNKVQLKNVSITAGITVTMNRFFSGTPAQACVVSSTGANYTIAFQDGFEKIAKNVQVSGATISRPMQLMIITNSRFNTNRSTNGLGIRYYNQLPNGVPRNAPSIPDATTYPAMGLVNDPCFQYS